MQCEEHCFIYFRQTEGPGGEEFQPLKDSIGLFGLVE